MRIIAGSFGGRSIKTPKDNSIRPTSDKIRGAIFNMLGARVDLQDAVVLDLCSGTGALGLEALSRGAEKCLFSDVSKTSLALTKENAAAFDVLHMSNFVLADACKLGNEKNLRADIFFCDPPYHMDLIEPVLENLDAQKLLSPGAIGILESEKNWSFANIEGFHSVKEKIYGDTKITLIEYMD